MPKKNTESEKVEIIRVRISAKERERCKEARLAGAFKDEAESTFMGYLVKLGITKYEKAILPIEIGEAEPLPIPSAKAKVS